MIASPVKQATFLSVVIPCFNETELIISLESLVNCDIPSCHTEVIIVINQPEDCTAAVDIQNRKTFQEAQKWIEFHQLDHILFFPIFRILETKHAGVGLARKIGMDEASRRFLESNVDGVIVCFDADSTCQKYYLFQLERHFKENTTSKGVSIHFEHPLEGPMNDENYEGITNYELHLRYYINAMRFAGHPHAFHTIGSSMAVRSSTYQKHGGMNRRKAGEDFYFLQKIIPQGNFFNLNSTTVYPSPRVSDRVPFGTGKAMGDWMLQNNRTSTTYNFQSFVELKSMLCQVDSFYRNTFKSAAECLSEPCQEFLKSQNAQVQLQRIKDTSPNFEAFYKKFFDWFSAFKVLKFTHFMRDHYYPNIPTLEAAKILLAALGTKVGDWNNIELLVHYRKIDSDSS